MICPNWSSEGKNCLNFASRAAVLNFSQKKRWYACYFKFQLNKNVSIVNKDENKYNKLLAENEAISISSKSSHKSSLVEKLQSWLFKLKISLEFFVVFS